MKIDRDEFFGIVRSLLFRGTMNERQVLGMEAIIAEWELHTKDEPLPSPWLAYMLATVYHETARTMQPIEEYGKGKGREYGKPDAETGQAYYGRGFVQLTWKNNYIRAGIKLQLDLLYHPELALDLEVATRILFDGMIEGWFTGKKLGDYFNARTMDYYSARRIINGVDRAADIAQYAICFREAIVQAA